MGCCKNLPDIDGKTSSCGGAAKLHTWPKSGLAGRAQNPPAAAAPTMGPAVMVETSSLGPSTVSSSLRRRLPKMKGVRPRSGAEGFWSREAETLGLEEPLTETETVEKLAGVVPVPVAAIIDGSAWRSSHSMVWPSDLWPSSRVNWNTLAAQMIGIRIRRPRPSTLL